MGNYYAIIQKDNELYHFNPNHDELGRFASGPSGRVTKTLRKKYNKYNKYNERASRSYMTAEKRENRLLFHDEGSVKRAIDKGNRYKRKANITAASGKRYFERQLKRSNAGKIKLSDEAMKYGNDFIDAVSKSSNQFYNRSIRELYKYDAD